MKKRLFAIVSALAITASCHLHAKRNVINKDDKENTKQVLWGTGAVGAAALTAYLGLKDPKALLPSGIGLFCAYKWFEKITQRALDHKYEDLSEFITDDTLSKLYELWQHIGLRFDFVYKLN